MTYKPSKIHAKSNKKRNRKPKSKQNECLNFDIMFDMETFPGETENEVFFTFDNGFEDTLEDETNIK